MANTFSFVGYLKPIKSTEKFNSFSTTTFDSGWMNERLVFHVKAGDNMHRVEINAGRWSDEKKNVIYGFTKGDGDKKGEAIQIPWAKRNDSDVIESMAGWKIFTVDLDTFNHRKELEEAGETEALEAANKKRKHFLAGTEFCEYVNKVVNSDKTKDMKFRVNGNVTYRYSEKNDQYYSTYEVTKIYRVDDDADVSSEVNIEFYFAENAMDASDYAETGKAIVNGFTPYYESSLKKTCYCPVTLALRFGTDEEGLKKIKGWQKTFNKFEDDEIRKVNLVCQQINGAQRVAITYDDLDDDTKENIDFGLTTLEEVIRDMGSSMFGDKIQEIRIEKLGRGSTKGSETTMFTLDDMTKKPFKDAVEDEEEEDKEEVVDLFDDEDDDL
jgi:hypothetical protein